MNLVFYNHPNLDGRMAVRLCHKFLIKNTHNMFISYTIENYIDPNSENDCEVFSVSIDGKKVYERDYGSCTEDITDYINDYKNHTP